MSLEATPLPGLHRIALRTPTLPPATTTNVWIWGDRSVVVIDPASPWPDEQARLYSALEGRLIDRILLTHHHHDHVGGALDLRRRTEAPIQASAGTADRLPFTIDGHLEERIPTEAGPLRRIETPGHAVGHSCFLHEESGTLVAGDMVAGEGTILIDPPEGHLRTYLASLEALIALAPARLLPAHGPILEPALPVLQEYLTHRAMRTEQVLGGLAAMGPSHALELAPRIYTELPAVFHPIAARQILAHLRWLEEEDLVEAEGERFRLA